MNKKQSHTLISIVQILNSDQEVDDEKIAEWIRDVITKSDLSDTYKQVSDTKVDK